MLSLLSDEYRGKIQGLRIGAASCDITDAKTDALTATQVTSTQVTTGLISPPVVGGDINLSAGAINRRNTYFSYQYAGVSRFISTFMTDIGSSLAWNPTTETKTINQTNFTLPWVESSLGYTEPILFSEPSIYTVTISIQATNSAYPVTFTLVGVDPSNNQYSTKIASNTLPVGFHTMSFTGTWRRFGTASVLSFAMFSPTGGQTDLTGMAIDITANRIN